MSGHPVDGEQGEIRGLLKLFKMPTSSGARGVNTTQMSAGDPTSQTKLAATCTNTPPCLPHIVCAPLKTYILHLGWIAILVRAGPVLFILLLEALTLLSLKQTWRTSKEGYCFVNLAVIRSSIKRCNQRQLTCKVSAPFGLVKIKLKPICWCWLTE